MCSVTNTVILYRLDSLPQLWQSLPLWTAAHRVVLEFADLFFFWNFSDICKVGWNVKQATHTHTHRPQLGWRENTVVKVLFVVWLSCFLHYYILFAIEWVVTGDNLHRDMKLKYLELLLYWITWTVFTWRGPTTTWMDVSCYKYWNSDQKITVIAVYGEYFCLTHQLSHSFNCEICKW